MGFGHVARTAWLPTLQAAGLECHAFDVAGPAREYARARGCPVHKRLPAAMDEHDVAIILTPSPRHAEDAAAVLSAGYHVLIEKPAAANMSEWQYLSTIARRSCRALFASPFTYAGCAAERLQAILRNGSLGPLRHVVLTSIKEGPYVQGRLPLERSWFVRPDAGPARDFGPYPLALLTHLLGPMSQVSWTVTRNQSQDALLLQAQAGTCSVSGVFAYGRAPDGVSPVMLEFDGGRLVFDSEKVDQMPGRPGHTAPPENPTCNRTKYELALHYLLRERQNLHAMRENHRITDQVLRVLERLPMTEAGVTR